MNNDISHQAEVHQTAPRSEIGRRIDGAAWAAVLIWIGTSILVNVGWGWFLAGLGIIVLGSQAVIHRAGEKLDGFWLVCGVAFLTGGIWHIFNMELPLAPILLILLGIGLLWRAFVDVPKRTS
jgi:hypothetical protein